MSNINQQFLIEEYKSRINAVFDFVDKNLGKKINLTELAEVANFSKYHFHRIFHGMLGETPMQFIARLRLERAASMLVFNQKKTITEIAEICGFADSATFARSFKNYFGMSATDWRSVNNNTKSNTGKKISNNDQIHSKNNQSKNWLSMYICPESKIIKWRTNMELNKNVEVKELQKMTVAYIRHIGPYEGDSYLFERLFGKLMGWAGPRGLLSQSAVKSICIYHDDPEVTEPENLRTSICITVPEDTKVDGEIGKMDIEGGKYVVANFEVKPAQFKEAWEWLYGFWFPASGYQPGDGPCFEMYSEESTKDLFKVDICVPVKPL